jgi:hypothetical protein
MQVQTGGFWDELCAIQGELRRGRPRRNLALHCWLARPARKADISCERDQLWAHYRWLKEHGGRHGIGRIAWHDIGSSVRAGGS